MIDHFFSGIHGFFTWPQYYSHVARVMPAQAHCVEVGACDGQSAAYLAVELSNECQRRRTATFPGVTMNFPRLDLVDNFGWQQSTVDRLRSTLDPVKHIIGEIHMSDSAEAAKKYPDAHDGEGLDFVFIDADHSYGSVRADIAAWLPKVKSGGIIAGHDFAPEFPGVIQAVSEAFERWECWRGERWGDQRMQSTGQYYSVWSVTRP